MSDRIEVFDVTVATGTTPTVPQTSAMPFVRGRTDRLEIRVPPGPSGLVGFRIAHSGQPIIPRSGTAWIVTDDQNLDWDVDNYPTGDAWEFVAYNTDVYSHVIQVRFHVTELATTVAGSVTPIEVAPIATAEDVGAEVEDFAESNEDVS